MVTTHVYIEPRPESQLVDGRIGVNPVDVAKAPKLSQPLAWALAHIWALIRGDAILAAVGNPVLAFHDWISDPPMTERDRTKHYIVETRKASKKRRLAGR